MKILVTGTGTILGQAIANKLLSEKKQVIATYRKSYPQLKKKKNLKIIKFNLNKKFNFKNYYDVLIHCASAIPSDNFSDKKIFQTNYYGFKNLVNNAIKNNCKKIILISTLSVYGNIRTRYLDESYFGKNLDAYGKSKLEMEKYLKGISKKKKITCIIFRLPGVVGKNSHSFLSKILTKIKKNQKIIFSNPELKFNSFIHVDNFSDIVFQFLKKQKKNVTYNIGTLYPLKLKSIILRLFYAFKKKPNFKIIRSQNKGFSIKLSQNLKKKCKIFSTNKTLNLFIKDNLR